MNPFKKEKILGLPDARDKNIYEKTPEQLKAMRMSKKEYGSDHIVNILNKKINSGENTGEYIEDNLSQQIHELENERSNILSDDTVNNCYINTKELILMQAEIEDLEEELKNVLLSNDNKDDGYNEKILILNAKNKDIGDLSDKINQAGEDAIKKVGEIFKIDEKISELISKHRGTFGNQDIKTEQGQYLN
jgi:hypothetical protein